MVPHHSAPLLFQIHIQQLSLVRGASLGVTSVEDGLRYTVAVWRISGGCTTSSNTVRVMEIHNCNVNNNAVRAIQTKRVVSKCSTLYLLSQVLLMIRLCQMAPAIACDAIPGSIPWPCARAEHAVRARHAADCHRAQKEMEPTDGPTSSCFPRAAVCHDDVAQ